MQQLIKVEIGADRGCAASLAVGLGRFSSISSFEHQRETRHTGDAPSNQPIVAGVFPRGNMSTLEQIFLSLSHKHTLSLFLSPSEANLSAVLVSG